MSCGAAGGGERRLLTFAFDSQAEQKAAQRPLFVGEKLRESFSSPSFPSTTTPNL